MLTLVIKGVGITNCCKGQSYAPAIYGSLRSLYHILLPLHFAPEQGVMFYKKNSSLNMKKFSFLLMIMCGYAQAGGDCELTEEYKVEKWEFEKVLRQNLNECLYSISQANYWYAASQCVEKTKHLPIIEGNCLYNAAHKGGEFQRIEITTDICKHYDRDSEFYRRALLEEMQRQKVRKCK